VALAVWSGMVALPAAAAQDRPIAFVGARLITISGAEIPDGVLVVQGGKITGVGARARVSIPGGAEVRDASGKVIMPGLIETHLHVGGRQGTGAPATQFPDPNFRPEFNQLDALNPQSPGFTRARADGITTVNALPGSGLLMSGQSVYIKLRPDAKTPADMLLCSNPATEVCGGLKMANGTNPKGSPPRPQTRSKAAALMRAKLIAATEYKRAIERAEQGRGPQPPRDSALDVLVQVLDRRRIVHFHTHRHDDILTVLRLQREFGFRMVLHHLTEGWKVPEEIARARVAVSVNMLEGPGGKAEALDRKLATAAILHRAGVPVTIHTDAVGDNQIMLRRTAAIMVREGLDRRAALAAITLTAARALDLADRIGSLERGKDADFVILSGDPLGARSFVEQTWVDGRVAYDRSNPDDLRILRSAGESR
jgi:imidazolonepropionase-like amidohydrolase